MYETEENPWNSIFLSGLQLLNFGSWRLVYLGERERLLPLVFMLGCWEILKAENRTQLQNSISGRLTLTLMLQLNKI